eukprot:997351_1
MESYWTWIVVLTVTTISLQLIKNFQNKTSKHSESDNQETNTTQQSLADTENYAAFKSFQIKFAIVFLTAMFADWMTGAYLYKLYAAYLRKGGNEDTAQIAILYMVGFASSAFVSSFIGSLADKFGRKKMCLLFCVTYATCALVKHINNYKVLLLARFLGGLSTSILFSCFESWMISEHHKRGFKPSWMGSTFQLVWGLNSIVAIVAGFVSQIANDVYANFGFAPWFTPSCIAPFDISAVVLGVALIMILMFWENENYGNSEIKIMSSLKRTVHVLFKDGNYNAVTLGLLSACFEGTMYVFVFAWWGTLTDARKAQGGVGIETGMIFTVFMMGCLVGTLLNGCLSSYMKAEGIVVGLCSVASVVMMAQKYLFLKNYEYHFAGFIIFEICVGMYWPIIGGLREKYIPDGVRATVMNLFRIPLNMVVILGLWIYEDLGDNKFVFFGVTLVMASACALSLCFANTEKNDAEVDNDARV